MRKYDLENSDAFSLIIQGDPSSITCCPINIRVGPSFFTVSILQIRCQLYVQNSPDLIKFENTFMFYDSVMGKS